MSASLDASRRWAIASWTAATRIPGARSAGEPGSPSPPSGHGPRGRTSARRRVLYVLPSFGTGGTERIVVDLVTRLDPGQFDAQVCAQQGGLFGSALQAAGRPVRLLEAPLNGERRRLSSKVRALFARVSALRRLIARERIDLVHTHHLGPLFHASLAGMTGRRWGWVHTEHVRPDVDDGYQRWLVGLAPRLLARPDVVTGVADAVGSYLRDSRRAASDRVAVIYNGVDVDGFAGPHDGAAKRRELGLPLEAWVVGSVGGLRPQKNHALLLRTLAQILPEMPDARLVVVGDGQERARLEELADRLAVRPAVHFVGARLDVPQILAAFDVYCLASRYEGMPLTIFEAMAAGKPIVATAVIGTREVIDDGRTGLLVPSDDAEALARALRRLRDEPALGQALVAAARRHVDDHARLETMVDRYAALYDDVLARRAP